jgi:Spy/CpxP family protein refolding chaperone
LQVTEASREPSLLVRARDFTFLYPARGMSERTPPVIAHGGSKENMNRWIHRLVTFASITSALALVPAGVALAQDAQPQGQAHPGEHHRRGRHQGVFGAALKLESLSSEQRSQVEQLVQARRAASAPVRQADAQLLTVLAQQVESAKVDAQAQTPSLAAEQAAQTSEVQVDRATLARLHAILTPAQRNQLVDAIEARAAQGHQDAEGRTHVTGNGFGGARLGLTPEQKAQIRANLGEAPRGERKVERGPMHAALESFRGESFDASAVARVQPKGEREARLTNAMIPVLTPNQRTTLATHLRNRAAHESRS